MGKKRIEIIITSVLILVLILVWVNSVKVLKKRFKPKAKSQVALLSVSSVEPQVVELKEREWNEDKFLEWVRCPFCGKRYGEGEEEEEVEVVVDLAISGIIWDEVRPQAIINDEILGEGDSIEGFLIDKIERQKVFLSNKKRKIELTL